MIKTPHLALESAKYKAWHYNKAFYIITDQHGQYHIDPTPPNLYYAGPYRIVYPDGKVEEKNPC